MYCKHCGSIIDDDSTFCSVCGQSIVVPKEPNKNEVVGVMKKVEKNPQPKKIKVSKKEPSKVKKKTPTYYSKNDNYSTGDNLRNIFKSIGTLVVSIGLLVGIGVGAIKLKKNSDSKSSFFMRLIESDIHYSDFEYTFSIDTEAITVFLIPNINMNYCDVELEIYGLKELFDDDTLLYGNTLSKEDLINNRIYEYRFENSIFSAVLSDQIYLDFSGKCIRFF